MALQIGDKMPAFMLNEDNGKLFTEKELTAKLTVIYFYPKDSTPGCTAEAIDFDNYLPEFRELGCEVIGISKDGVESHYKFKQKYKLSIMLLSDPDLELHKAFGAYGEKTSFGKTSMGVIRSTFIVNADLKVVALYPKVVVKEHAKKVLNKVKELLGIK